jgi:hypothetical protein
VEPYCHFPTHAVTLSLLICTQRVLTRLLHAARPHNQKTLSYNKAFERISMDPQPPPSSSSVVLVLHFGSDDRFQLADKDQGDRMGDRRWGSHVHQQWGYLLWPQHTANNVLLPCHLQVHYRQTILYMYLGLFSHLKNNKDINLNYIQKSCPYRAVNTIHLGYKNQSHKCCIRK